MSETKAHIHAALMMQYAHDAMETDKPWERWQIKHRGYNEWIDIVFQGVMFCDANEYRRKPKTITINGIDVPEPLRVAPALGTIVYRVNFLYPDAEIILNWRGTSCDNSFFKKGILHTTGEASRLHAKALLSFTEIKEE